MDLVELGCLCLQTPYLETFMEFAALFGYNSTAAIISGGLLAYGYYFKNERIKRVGYATILALVTMGVTVQVLKFTLQMPRPVLTSTYGFPSGDSSVAFTLASTLSMAFPAMAPALYLLAMATAISRLYFRAHFVWDVLGGSAIGIFFGILFSRKIFSIAGERLRRSQFAYATWTLTGLAAITVLTFFYVLERKISIHKIPQRFAEESLPTQGSIDLTTPSDRVHLIDGWPKNNLAEGIRTKGRWVVGRVASLIVNVPTVQNYRMRFQAFPFAPDGFLCQWMDIRINARPVRRVYLEESWQTYEIAIPKEAFKQGTNQVDFALAYSSTTKRRKKNPEGKPLSVAFDKIYLYLDNPN